MIKILSIQIDYPGIPMPIKMVPTHWPNVPYNPPKPQNAFFSAYAVNYDEWNTYLSNEYIVSKIYDRTE